MASLKQAQNTDLTGYEPVAPRAIGALPPMMDFQPVYNPYIRCPLPPISVTPDSLRQYYVGGQVPQFRVLTPPNTSNGGSGNGSSTTVIQTAVSTTTSSSGGTSTSTSIVAKSISLTTAILNPNDIYFGSISTSKSFQLLNISSSSPCRIEIYGSNIAQTLDAGRGLDVAPTPGTQQDLITDIVLDTAPYQWSWQNRVGHNADNPQNGVAYVTVTNIDAISEAITITLIYVPLES